MGFVLSPVGGKIAAKHGAKVTTAIGISVGFLGFAVVSSIPIAVIASVVIGTGTALMLAGLPNLVVEAVPPHNTGEAVGLVYGVGRTFLSAIGTAIIGLMLASSVEPGTTHPTLAWYTVIAFVAIRAALGLVAALLVRKIKPMDQRGEVIEALVEAEEIDEGKAAAEPSTIREAGVPATRS